ncbi:MAG: S41 family peptidase, partial [Bacteroidota bacterium]|nr:S41 family peptidase [Bacteroidota bacterium]
FKELVNKLKKHHPRLYSFTSETDFEKQSEEIYSHLNEDMSTEQFYRRIAPLIASVKCSHTGIRLPGQYLQFIHETGHYFPLRLFIHEKKAYCLSTSGNPGVDLVPGSEILTINRRPVSQIIEELLAIIPSEGYCMTTRYQELNRDFHNYFHMMDPAERFLVEFSSSGSKSSIQMEACSYEQVPQMEHTPLPARDYGFHMENDPECGILKVASFGIRNMEDYFSFLDSTIQLMNHSRTPNLVLDLRDNRGGHPIFAAQLFSYLTDTDFTYFQRNPDVEEFEPLYNPMQANENHFKGSIYVLVNGNCLSTTGHLISLLKYHTEALFIGEEPGSTFSCNDFSIQVQLSNTGMELNIPRTTFVTAVTGFSEKEPFPVDYKVNMSIEDLLNGNDTYKSFVEDLITNKS